LPEISAGWIVSGAADPAVSGNDQGWNFCAYGIWDIAAAKTAVAADGISRATVTIAIPRARAIVVIITPAVETEAAIVAVADKKTTGATAAAVESGEAAMKAAAVETSAVKTAAEAAFGISGSGDENHQKCGTKP
jgi:hypothetical protein